jgi:hypothetical protein
MRFPNRLDRYIETTVTASTGPVFALVVMSRGSYQHSCSIRILGTALYFFPAGAIENHAR